MKRVLALLLALILCLGMFAGCGKDEEPTEATTEATTGKVQESDEVEITMDDLKSGLAFVKTSYKNVSETTPSDFKRIASVPIKKIPHDVVWTVNVAEDLVKVLPAVNGQVTIDVNEKSPEEVPYELTATISNSKGESVSHTWKHILPAAASLEDMQEIVKAAYELPKGQSMGYAVTLQGEITMINTPWDDAYQNISVTFVVEGCEDMPIQAYRMKGDGCKDLKIGDTITVTGELKNYNGTIEFDAGCTLDAVIKGEEIKAPEDPKQIVDEAYALGANQSLKYEATLTGTIISVGTPYDAGYKNITVTMEIEGRESKPIQCYRLKGDGADKIGINDIITVKGYITNYVGSKGYSTIQFTAGCQLVSWEDRATPTQPSDPKQVVDEAYALGANKSLKYEATLTGRIVKVGSPYDANYGNITVSIVIEGRETKPIVCYRMKGNGVDKIGMNDTITVKGYITNYVGDAGYSTIEYNYPTLVSYTKNTAVAPSSSLEIVREAYQLAPGKQLPYEATVTGKITKVNTPYDSGYKNVTVTIVVEGAEDMPIKCYRLKGDAASKVGVGDTITVKGYIENYQHSSGDTEVEFVAGCIITNWIDGGSTAPETPDVPVTPGSTVLNDGDKVVIYAPAYNKALSADKVDETSYYNKGVDVTVSGNTVSGYGNSEIWTVIANADGTYSFSNGGKNIALGVEFSSMNLGEVNDDWKLISLGGTLFNVQNVGRGNFIEWYASKENWSTYNSSRAATDDQFQLSFFVIGTGIVEDDTTPEDPTPDVPVQPETGLTFVDAPEVGKAYKLGMQQNGLTTPALLLFTGEMSSYYYGTTEDETAAVDVYLEAANDGYYLYFMNGSTKTYLDIVQRDGYDDKVNVVFQTSGSHTVYKLNTEYKYLYANVLDIEWYLGTYGTNKSISASKTSYISDTSTIGVSQFCAWLLEEGEVDPEPDDPTPEQPTTGVTFVDAPQAGVAYKFVLNQTGLGKKLGFTGVMDGYYYGTSENGDEMVDVYLETVTGGYRIYFMNGTAKTYLNVVPRETDATKINVVLQTIEENSNPSVYELNTEFKYVKTAVADAEWYMGTYGTYSTINASKTSYIEDTSTIGVTQFTTWFATVEAGGTTPEPDDPTPDVPATGAEMVTAPEAGTAYKLGMDFEGAIHYITGGTGSQSYYLATTTNVANAVDVYLEEEAGCYYLYFMNGSTKTYIRVYEYYDESKQKDRGSLALTTEKPMESYTFDAATNTLFCVDEDGEDTYYMGTYFNTSANKIYDTVSTSNISYITGENASKIGVSQFPVHLYTVTGSTTPDPEPEEPTPTGTTAGLMVDLPVAGDVVIIYNSGMAMTATDNGGKLAGETAAVTDNLLNVTTTMAQLTVGMDGEYYVFICGGKYLTSAATGNGLTLESELTDLGRWTLRALDGTNAWIIKNVGANYNGNYNQALETYNGNFTTYGEKETEIYQMQLFKVGGAAPEVTPPGGTTPEPDDEPVTPPPADTDGQYRKIEKVADLTAGTYLIAAYAESYNDTSFAANPWHFWDGNLSTGNNSDMITNTYAFANGSLTKYENSAVGAATNGDAVEIQLIAVEGKANTYYIKLGDQYVTASYAKRKLALSSTPAEWVAEDHANGGIVLHHYVDSGFVTLGFGGAATNMIRSYMDKSGAMNTGIKAGLYFFAENN